MTCYELCHLVLIYCINLVKHCKDQKRIESGHHVWVMTNVTPKASTLMLTCLNESSYLLLSLIT